MYERFVVNSNNIVTINAFKTNTPLNICTENNRYLSCAEHDNIVDFYTHDDNSGRQKWIIEKDKDGYYIKCAFQRYNSTQYLGCPNKNNTVFLYTSKNKYTRWSINHVSDNKYNINYIGDKFKFNNDVADNIDSINYKIIVARYNENISWLDPLQDKCIIYNKGSPLQISNERSLKNIGRESHTYLNYIIDNYDHLSDILVFTQANIADHRGNNDYTYLHKLVKEANIYGKSLQSESYTINVTNDKPHWAPDFNKYDLLHLPYKNNNRITFIDWFKTHIINDYPTTFHIYANALFAVKKELILQHPKSYYETLLEECNYHINPIEGHFFERSWYYIFPSICNSKLLHESIIICYSTPNYEPLTNIALESLYKININSNNIKHKLDILPDLKDTGFMGDLFYYCIIKKVKHLVDMLKQYKNTSKYYISLDLDIWFIENNIHHWDNLQSFIDNNPNHVFFMKESTNSEANGGFFIIKNENIDETITFFENIYHKLITTPRNELRMLEQELINNDKHLIKYDYIPTEYVVWGEQIFNSSKSLFHHAVCCKNIQEKMFQINSIKQIFMTKMTTLS